MGVNESNIKNDKESGFRIYKIINGGPLDKAGLKILDDFLIPPEEINRKIKQLGKINGKFLGSLPFFLYICHMKSDKTHKTFISN